MSTKAQFTLPEAPPLTPPIARPSTGQNLLISAGMVLSLVLLVGAGMVSARYMSGLAQADQLTTRSYLVRQELEELLSALKDVETGERGFVLTGEESYLEPYDAGVSGVARHLALLEDSARGSPTRQQRLAALRPLIQEKLDHCQQVVELLRTKDLPSALAVVDMDKGKRVMDKIRAEVAAGLGEEQRLLELRAARKELETRDTIKALLAGGGFSLLLVAAIFLFLKQENRRRTEAEADLRRHRDQLQELVAARTAQLDLANQQLRREIEAHQRAAVAQARLAAIVEWSEDAILSLSLDGKIQTWNAGAERMFGYPAGEVIGQPVALLIPPERSDEEARVLGRLKRGETIAHYETVRVAKNGRRLEVALTVSPIKDSQDQISGASGIVRDIGELVEAHRVLIRGKQELEQLVAERTAKLQEFVGELEHFSYAIIHDLRAPLRAIQGFASLIEEECPGGSGPEANKYLGRIRRAAARMDLLITDALNYNQAIRRELTLAPVDADALLRTMLDSYPQFQAARADIQIAARIPLVLGNEAGLTQCFSNLLDNAVKFVRPGQKPQIRIWPEAEDGWVRICVADQGVGIPETMQSRLFDMFSRGHQNYPGTGIGLALVRKVMERMGGKVTVESEAGRGSRFWLHLRPAEGG